MKWERIVGVFFIWIVLGLIFDIGREYGKHQADQWWNAHWPMNPTHVEMPDLSTAICTGGNCIGPPSWAFEDGKITTFECTTGIPSHLSTGSAPPAER